MGRSVSQRISDSRIIPLIKRIELNDATGCWNWRGAKHPNGYGQAWYKGKYVSAHRLAAHLWLRMPLDSQYFALHKCNNKSCWNPKHLYAGNKSQNAADCVRAGNHFQSRKTHCPQGHPLVDGNLEAWALSKGRRKCLACTKHRTPMTNLLDKELLVVKDSI